MHFDETEFELSLTKNDTCITKKFLPPFSSYFILMDFPISFDRISLEMPILYFKIMMYFCLTDLFLSVQTV